MNKRPESDHILDELFLAGEKVPPGVYRQVGSSRQIIFDQEDFLPASLDGKVACYTRLHRQWRHIEQQSPT